MGVMSLNDLSKTLEIGTLAVQRSQCREGVGSYLVRFAIAKAERAGKRKVSVGSFCFYGAKNFYLRSGFRIVSTYAYRGHRSHDFELLISRMCRRKGGTFYIFATNLRFRLRVHRFIVQ